MSLKNKLLLSVALLLAAPQAHAYAQGVKERRSMAPIELKTTEPSALVQSGVPVEDSEPADLQDEMDKRFTVPADAGISVQPASYLSLDTLGLYDESKGGLPQNIWRNTEYGRVVVLLDKLPQSVPSNTLRQLVVRLLLTSATPPQTANIQQTIFRPRVMALLQLGEISQAQRLMELAPANQRSGEFARMEFATHLLGDDVKWACEHVSSVLSQPHADPAYWQKLSLFCLARDKKEAQAQLAIDAGDEQGKTFDPAFLSLIDAMLERSAAPSRFSQPLSLDDATFVALSGKDAFPEGYLTTAPLPIAQLVADHAGFSEAVRAQAKQRVQEESLAPTLSATQTALQSFLNQQFSLAGDAYYDFDSAVRQLTQKTGKMPAPEQLYRFYSMLQGVGFSNISVSDPWNRASLSTNGRMQVSPWLRAEMAAAVDGERLGESLLLMASVAGQMKSLAVMDDDALTELVLALAQLGLQKEAQALAVEAMLALY